jgi:hypothetical protein
MDVIKEALLDAIEKWKNIVAGKCHDGGWIDCLLCHIFYTECDGGCPIYLKTGQKGCYGTPYDEWCNHFLESQQDGTDEGDLWFADNAKTKQLAQNMLDFLKDLYQELYGDLKDAKT